MIGQCIEYPYLLMDCYSDQALSVSMSMNIIATIEMFVEIDERITSAVSNAFVKY